jgi:transcriptional regulator with XRE-family HTH domain
VSRTDKLTARTNGDIGGGAEAMKERTRQEFGARLAMLRQQRGLTQAELGRAIGVSQRMITYYETASPQPPGALLADLARVLQVSTDELLGLTPVAERVSPKLARFRKRLRKAEALPAADQRAVLQLIDALYEAHQHTQGSRPVRRLRPTQ